MFELTLMPSTLQKRIEKVTAQLQTGDVDADEAGELLDSVAEIQESLRMYKKAGLSVDDDWQHIREASNALDEASWPGHDAEDHEEWVTRAESALNQMSVRFSDSVVHDALSEAQDEVDIDAAEQTVAFLDEHDEDWP